MFEHLGRWTEGLPALVLQCLAVCLALQQLLPHPKILAEHTPTRHPSAHQCTLLCQGASEGRANLAGVGFYDAPRREEGAQHTVRPPQPGAHQRGGGALREGWHAEGCWGCPGWQKPGDWPQLEPFICANHTIWEGRRGA